MYVEGSPMSARIPRRAHAAHSWSSEDAQGRVRFARGLVFWWWVAIIERATGSAAPPRSCSDRKLGDPPRQNSLLASPFGTARNDRDPPPRVVAREQFRPVASYPPYFTWFWTVCHGFSYGTRTGFVRPFIRVGLAGVIPG